MKLKCDAKVCRKVLILCERFRISCCISPTIFKKLTISAKIDGFLKFVGKIQHLVWKRSLKNN